MEWHKTKLKAQELKWTLKAESWPKSREHERLFMNLNAILMKLGGETYNVVCKNNNTVIITWYTVCKQYNLNCQVSKYICTHNLQSMQCYGTINDSMTDKTLRKIYEYASELRKCLHFHIQKLLFFSIFLELCRYKWHTCRLICTDRFPNVPIKQKKNIF